MKAFSDFRFLSIIGAAAVISIFAAANSSTADEIKHINADHSAEIAIPEVTAMGSIIDKTGTEIGRLNIQEGPKGLLLSLSMRGLTEGKHGIHIHEKGDCSDLETFKSAGAHFVPEALEDQGAGYFDPNGGPHAGSLPNVIAHEDGIVDVEIYTHLITLDKGPTAILDEDGSALVVHTGADDYASHTAAGSRIACAVIERVEKVQRDQPIEE